MCEANIKFVREAFDGRDSTNDASSGVKNTRVFKVRTTEPIISPVFVRTACDPEDPDRLDIRRYIPLIGSPHPDEPVTRVTNVHPRPIRESMVDWLVVVTYRVTELEENPLSDPVRWEWGGTPRNEPYFVDVNDNKVVTAAGVPFDPMPTRDRGTPTALITKNQSRFDAGDALTYWHKTNSSPFGGAATGEAKMGIITARPAERNGIHYWVVRYPVEFKEGGWNDELENVGVLQRDANGELVRIRDAHGDPVNYPVPLDVNGKAVLDGEVITLQLRPYESKDFGPLGLE